MRERKVVERLGWLSDYGNVPVAPWTRNRGEVPCFTLFLKNTMYNEASNGFVGFAIHCCLKKKCNKQGWLPPVYSHGFAGAFSTIWRTQRPLYAFPSFRFHHSCSLCLSIRGANRGHEILEASTALQQATVGPLVVSSSFPLLSLSLFFFFLFVCRRCSDLKSRTALVCCWYGSECPAPSGSGWFGKHWFGLIMLILQ